jgi:hypothetical protein
MEMERARRAWLNHRRLVEKAVAKAVLSPKREYLFAGFSPRERRTMEALLLSESRPGYEETGRMLAAEGLGLLKAPGACPSGERVRQVFEKSLRKCWFRLVLD